MGTMLPLVKHKMTVIVLIAKKSRYQWTMCVQRVLKTNLLHPNKGGFGEDFLYETSQKAAETFYSGSWIVLHEVEY